MSSTLLAIDIGNTAITCGFFKGRRLTRTLCVPTRDYKKFALVYKGVGDCIIASVVPEATRSVTDYMQRASHIQPYVLGENITAPIRNRYRKPRQVGQDRLVNAYAAALRWGAPAIVVDYGTAVTFDIVSQKNDYIGGMIFPGLHMSLAALHEKTALLPRIKLAKPSMFFGRNTRSSILSGVIYGYAAMTESLVSKIQSRIARPAVVIGTGGDINLIAEYTRIFTAVDRHLTLKGLQLIYEARVNNLCACNGRASVGVKRSR